jgi:uncharacterized membrane protein YwaF
MNASKGIMPFIYGGSRAMADFLRKFFGYYPNPEYEGRMMAYNDGLGGGTFGDIRHLIVALVTIGLCVGSYHLFKRYKRAGRITVLVLCAYMFTVRLINRIVQAIVHTDFSPWMAIIPFHLCSIMSYLLPLTVFFRWEKIKTAVYVSGLIGAVVNLVLSDDYGSLFIPFTPLESMWVHITLLLVPVIHIATGDFRLEWKKFWHVVLTFCIVAGWSALANWVFFKEYDTNYFYIAKNALPGNIGGDFYIFVYLALFAVFLTAVFGPPELTRYIKAKKAAARRRADVA